MNSTQSPLFPDVIDEVKDKFWLTPPWLMKQLMTEFKFDFDAAPYPRPAGFDALKEEWGLRSWLNPPIESGNSLSEWVRKAVEEHKKGKLVVALLPFPRWYRDLLSIGAEFRYPGPIHFLNSKGAEGKSEGGGRIPDIIVIMRPKEHNG